MPMMIEQQYRDEAKAYFDEHVKVGDTTVLAYDPIRKQAGCVLVQAGFGCHGLISHLFPTDTWLLTPTVSMGRFRVNVEQLAFLIQHANRTSIEYMPKAKSQ